MKIFICGDYSFGTLMCGSDPCEARPDDHGVNLKRQSPRAVVADIVAGRHLVHTRCERRILGHRRDPEHEAEKSSWGYCSAIREHDNGLLGSHVLLYSISTNEACFFRS